jgi:RNAse (barnase) inhibitor barstar
MNLDEQKEKLSVKLDENKVKLEEKRAQVKLNRNERKLKLKEKYTDKKISDHIERAIRKIFKAEDDAEKNIDKVLDIVNSEIEANEKPIELILFKADNKLVEILLEAEFKMQKAKNGLIKDFEKDIKSVEEVVSMQEDISVFKAEIDDISNLLDERIDIEKETLNLKS